MGEYADMVLDGTMCQECGIYMGGSVDYPRSCAGCRRLTKAERIAAYEPPKPKLKCEICQRKVKPTGMADHLRDAHGVKN